MKEIESKIIEQLNKDLSLAGYKFTFNSFSSMNENIHLLIDWINVESQSNANKFSQFLYIIDLEESLVKPELNNDSESLAWLILTRLKNKVINREKYSKI